MKAFVMNGIGQGGVETLPDPVPRDNELVIAPAFSGLCGTDVHMFREGTLTTPEALPVVMGHEFVGRIVDANGHSSTLNGKRIENGSLVAIEPLLPCGTCRMCLRGKQNLCLDWDHLGILRDGCWADYVSVPASRISVVPEGVAARDAALSEPLAGAVNFISHQGRLQAGESVLILGGGPIGLLSAAFAKAAGAAMVAVSEPNGNRRELAKRCGADVVFDPSLEGFSEQILEATHGLGFDLVVEATGVPAVAGQAIEIAQPGSRVVLAGLGGNRSSGIIANSIVTKELEIRGGFASRWAMDSGLSAIAAGKIPTGELISSVRNWADAETAMEDMVTDPLTCKILFQGTIN